MPSTRGLARLLPHPPRLATPVGAVAFSGVFGTWHPPPRPTTAWRLPGGGTLSRWSHRAVTLDLLVGPLPSPVSLWGAVWYVVAHRRLAVVDLTVALPEATGSRESGEHLEALTVLSEDVRVTIGGPDADALARSAREGTHLPARWSSFEVAQTGPAALTWRLPPLSTGEHARVGATIAWGPGESARFAVNVPLDAALAALLGR